MNKPPHKAKKLGKNKLFSTFATLPDTHETNHNNIKTWKRKKQKNLFAMFKNNPLFFISFCFFQHAALLLHLLCFGENTITIVFSEEHSFSKTQLVKPTFSPMSNKTFFKKRCHFWFWAISAETTIFFLLFAGFHCFWSNIFGQNR